MSAETEPEAEPEPEVTEKEAEAEKVMDEAVVLLEQAIRDKYGWQEPGAGAGKYNAPAKREMNEIALRHRPGE